MVSKPVHCSVCNKEINCVHDIVHDYRCEEHGGVDILHTILYMVYDIKEGINLHSWNSQAKLKGK